ncbi:unnamed protein product [Periconia digitata]|uniref:Uncharacterized protein n=1 Tax=Periconia digitata TaxID=1303443 RepID=A0A9W4XP51_9PLEO|nr:unnamed protein product [Periconia digitata]
MVLKPFDNDVLDGLCSKDQVDLLNAVDRLRLQGIDHYVSLPQIIVCGDQSSGKSSVLETISGISFPVKGNLCTCFPTELILRKSPNVGLSVSTVPHQSHTKSEAESLRNFSETLSSFDALPELIEKAKGAMAIGSFGRAFSKDLLRIEISGPDRPHLTVVDLPGLIHSGTKQQSASDIGLVKDVVKSYMEEPRSIVLAVVSAKNDYANHIVISLARSADGSGTRTLGVITKPDTLTPGSDTEAKYVSLAQNLDVEFRLGWHVLKNMDSETGSWSLPKRDKEEQLFFSKGIWTNLNGSFLGISNFRERLSKLLLAQITTEIPSLLVDIESKSTKCRTELENLRRPRANIEEQRSYLIALSQNSQILVKAAIDGSYNHSFFGDAKTDAGYAKRIRAVVQNLNEEFAGVIVHRGHVYTIDVGRGTTKSLPHDTSILMSRTSFMAKIRSLLKRTRGCELPGTFNPLIVTDLFVEQSEPWEQLARDHVNKVADALDTFLQLLVDHIADASTRAALFESVIRPGFDRVRHDAVIRTTGLLKPHRLGHPITYNQDFTKTLLRVKKERRKICLEDTINKHLLDGHANNPSSRKLLLSTLVKEDEINMEDDACSEASLLYDDINVQVIETTMIAGLEKIISPIGMHSLSTEKVTGIAGESDESRTRREQLMQQLRVLDSGTETCKNFMLRRIHGRSEKFNIDRLRTKAIGAN